ncbi:hypothetical protein DAPPUDRAFT_115918 [Daphnia pulex]|uniref:CCHC-type domain-containing protein n=1 Tax=Daphnia pulex TaxID=6669 RepID=E9HMZ0_DAPPU|nr:hypothetical protein DAPPUDRAFT_115918 [Daphnia pulex]|eukprot:EFX66896.1 hypothetical protein DAPPUDRAFT_115918 [Daphnia pulex]
MTTPTLPSKDTSYAALNESLIGEIDLEEDSYIRSLPLNILPIRETFLSQWNELIKLTKDVADKTSTRRVTRSDFLAKQKDIKSQVYNSLKQYTYEFYKKELGGSQYITGEAKEKVVDDLASYLVQLKGDSLVYNPLIQNIRTAHSKEVEFRNKAFKVFRRELIFKQLSIENYANSLEAQLETQKAKNCLVDNTRLTAEVDNLQLSNVKLATRIAELKSKVENQQTSGESKSFFNEYEAVKSDLEKMEDELSTKDEYIKNLKDTLTQLENDSKEKVKQLVDSYNALSIKHDILENSCKTADSEVIELKNKNSQLTAQLNKVINDNLANLTDLSDQNVQLTTQLTKLQQDVATKQLSVDCLRQTNKGLNIDIATLQQQLAQQTAQITQPPNMTPTPPTPPNPPTPPTAPIQNPLNQQQRQRTPSPDPNNVPLSKSHLRELYSQDERKSIPVYKGKRGDQLINNWFKDAERVAQSAGWSAKDKIKYFSDRLRGDAADWHSEYIDHAADKEDYDAWEKALINRFLTETEIENLKKQLNELKQTPDQSTQIYVSRLNHLYDIIHGKEIVLYETIAPPEAVVLARSLRKIRGEAKQKILLKGLLPKIVQVVWTRINVNSSYEDVCDIVYAAETIVNRMEQNEDKSLKATIAVAITEAYNRHRSPSGDRRRSNSESRIRFQQPLHHRPSQENNYSRERGRDSTYYRSRSPVGNRRFPEKNPYPRPRQFQDRASNNPNYRQAPYTNIRPRPTGNYNTQRDNRNRREIERYACGKRGHYARECRTNPPEPQQQRQ